MGSCLGTDEIFLIPCYDFVMKDAPQNGQTNWSAALRIIAAGTDFQREVSIRNLKLELDFGEETFFSSRVELNHGQKLYDLGVDRRVSIEDKMILSENEACQIDFLVGTSTQAKMENQRVQGSFIWSYDLYYGGKLVAEIRNDVISGEYIVNAV